MENGTLAGIGVPRRLVFLLPIILSIVWNQPASAEEQPVAARLLSAASLLGDRTLGAADAPVVMVEFASATCPHCAEFHAKVLPEIKRDYVDTGKVRFIFREFPLDQLALGAFMLARCLPEDMYFTAIDTLFATQSDWAKAQNPADQLLKVLQPLGMTRETFESCIKREDLANAIVGHMRSSADGFGIKGTPTIFVNGTLIDGHKEMSDVKVAIETAIGEQARQK
jgi:protein-disulfide isomerase